MVSPKKLLFLVRHAKSSWQDVSLPDHARPLNKRGKRDAPEMAERIARRPSPPEHVVTSPALRALTTAQVIATELEIEPTALEVDERLYGAGTGELVDVIRGLDDRLARVMVVGHNPCLTESVNLLAGTTIENVPTCGVAVLSLEATSWADVCSRSAELLEFDYPKKQPL